MYFSCRSSVFLACLLLLRGSWAWTPQVTHVWHGFRHQWERRDVGFETPHRLGSIRNFLVDDILSVQFTPGVNGDYAFPTSHFTSVQVDAERGQVAFTLEDDYDDDVQQTAHVQHSEIAPAGDLLLQGFAVQMKCVEPGVCNSNGIWPTKFSVSLCQNGQSPCEVHFELARGYTPFHGGGKPLNTRMQYNVILQWLRVAQGKESVEQFRLSNKASIHSKAVATQASINASAGLLGFRGFGFELLEKNVRSDVDDGRYLEGLDFSIRDWSFQGGQHSFAWSAGVWAPKSSTVNSGAQSWVDLMVVPTPTPIIPNNQALNGTVCMDDKAIPRTFKCQKWGFPEQLSAEVPVAPSSSQLASFLV